MQNGKCFPGPGHGSETSIARLTPESFLGARLAATSPAEHYREHFLEVLVGIVPMSYVLEYC